MRHAHFLPPNTKPVNNEEGRQHAHYVDELDYFNREPYWEKRKAKNKTKDPMMKIRGIQITRLKTKDWRKHIKHATAPE